MIHIDSREPAFMRMLVSAACKGDTSEAFLGSADYVVFDQDGHSLGIERKTASDLLGSLSHTNANGEKRVLDQIDRMGQTYDRTMLVIEEPFAFERATGHLKVGHGWRPTGWHHSAIQMILWSLQARGVPVLHTPDRFATADLMRVLNQRAKAGCVLPHVPGASVPPSAAQVLAVAA